MFDPAKILLRFSENPKDFWTVDDAVKGVSIIGGTGSGKTTASGKSLAKQYLKQGWGGLVLCAKTDEANLWREYCKETGREEDLIVFSKGSKHLTGKYAGEEMVFNPIDYEMKRSGIGAAETQNITNIFMNIYRMGNRIASEGDTQEERYWDTALKRCLNRVIELVNLAGEDLTYKNMVKILSSSNSVNEEKYLTKIVELKRSNDFSKVDKEENYCLKCIIKAYCLLFIPGQKATPEEVNSFELVYDYFLTILPTMSSKTKSVVTESYMGLAEPFLSGLLFKHFSGKTNVFPEEAYEQNKIIVLDFPVKEYLDAGIMAQCVVKLLFQQAIERRDVKKYPMPVFLWADEAQYFVNPYDQIFLTTARGSRAATVFLSQNISNYLAIMGSGEDAKARVDSMMGNLSTKIFHANSDAVTNEYASRLIGNAITLMSNKGSSQSFTNLSFQSSSGLTEQYQPQVQPREFTILKSGGENNNFQVDSVIFVSGKQWSNGTNFIKTFFKQVFIK
jgi:type IV secretory system conjugative DNA transfer VirD4/TraG family protein